MKIEKEPASPNEITGAGLHPGSAALANVQLILCPAHEWFDEIKSQGVSPMKLYILFGQRIERYPGEYAPEALEVMDEYGMEENPEYLDDKMQEFSKTEEFESLAIVPLAVDQSSIMNLLRPSAAEPIPAQVVPEKTKS